MLRSRTLFSSALCYKRSGEQPATQALRTCKQSAARCGVSVVSIDGHGPQASLAVVVKAGARSDGAGGLSHLVSAALLRVPPTNKELAQRLHRALSLRHPAAREHSAIPSRTRAYLNNIKIPQGRSVILTNFSVDVVPALISQLFNDKFQVHEFLDASGEVSEQTHAALASPTIQVFERLHQVAFRNGLGNPIYATDEALAEFNRADIQAYASEHFTADKISIVGTGVAHEELMELVDEAMEGLNLPKSSSTASKKTKYFGGEARFEGGPSSTSQYVIAYPGVSYNNPDYAASKVLACLLGGDSLVSFGGASGLLGPASTNQTTSKAFTVSYADAGLIGIRIEGVASEVKEVATKSIQILKQLSTGGLTPTLLNSAKNAVMIQHESLGYFSNNENISETPELFFNNVFAEVVRNVKVEDVVRLAKSAVCGKSSVVAHGNLLVLPYADEL
jgi:ubiquinol-cytochrome c reductase core subunit 2